MAAAKSPQEKLAEGIEQQKAAGNNVSDSSVTCAATGCDKPATYVAKRNLPLSGPVATTDDYHLTAEGLYVHRDTQ